MSEDVYRKLAQRLDAIPNGFPVTDSGVELRLLAKIFTPEEAALAAAMHLHREPAAAIAARAGVDPREAYVTLKAMSRKGQIRAGRKEGQLAFGLLPFVVGIYEEQLPRLDEELARLFEQYFVEAQGAVTRQSPSKRPSRLASRSCPTSGRQRCWKMPNPGACATVSAASSRN
jgi:electron transport complex protein RnfB